MRNLSAVSSEPASANELEAAEAVRRLDEIAAQPTLVRLSQATANYPAFRAALERVSARIAIVASFTVEPVVGALKLSAIRHGLGIHEYVAPFGQYERELIDDASGLANHRPDAVLIAVRLRDVLPDLYECFNSLEPGRAEELLNEWFSRLESALRAFRRHSSSPVLMQNYELPAYPAAGIAEAGMPGSQSQVIDRANQRLATLAASIDNCYVMDYANLVALAGRGQWADPRMALMARIPLASRHYWTLASFYVRHLRPLFGLSKKVLVVDADNTLWGGVVGDVGLNGIALGPDFPGNAFVAFQRRLLDLYHRGVVLCIASKNQPGSVDEVLDQHPNMVLRAKHFAAMRVDWAPKPQNVRQLAEELNLGLDSFVFVDDNPVECEMMRLQLPQVMTIQLPADPAAYAGIIESLDVFDQWTISTEDRKRGELYRAEADRKALKTESVSLEDFYRRLEMRVCIGINRARDVARAAQLTARTNQFNMHTVRCTEDDIRAFMTDGRHEVLTLALVDRFGDNGIVGAALVERGGDVHVLRMFLMSCRVLGRTVEHNFLRWITARALKAGAARLEAVYAPTPKNKPFGGFYAECGLALQPDAEGVQRWSMTLNAAPPAMSDWIEWTVEEPMTGK